MEDTQNQSCLIVGASHAGVNAAFALRRAGWAGTISIFDRDEELPYHRPPLSKGFLSGDTTVEESLLKAAASYETEQIGLHRGVSVRAIERSAKRIELADGTRHAYDKLILATGASPFIPPITGLKGSDKVFPLRTAADARGIRAAFMNSRGKNVVIIGGGYIGLEAAASLRKLGGEVTVLERENRVLARVTSPEMSAFFTDLHTQKGVAIATEHNVSSVEQHGDSLTVVCAGGLRFSADLVIVGVGVRVNTELARSAGLKNSNGILVDGRMLTSDPDIYAIGDCTSFHHPRYGREIRLESVQNAVDQAKVAAANICGSSTAYDAIPWFWSDQYEVKLQMCGIAAGYNRVIVRNEADSTPCKRSLWYFTDDQLVAVDAVNHARAYMLGMKILKEGRSPAPEKLADPEVELHPRSIMP
ncbi:NAD(P)/FAD-dependent oxidoreductase [Neolewinella aurantiaca]|uniref:NAD(P)/FAD-dependent oxidoreductase n=1 Tax=Neolewinella aurantiaca TaxID=2602767 RepID=A0A5C7FB57_9BACT|nr:FAD/NAD(P)-binding oxidoreductase [Neolewinella aurantiaca]TXF87918.1 NAD(P)/FAD-dependent oxidoreductase [Neolewinella aurantiaca]